MKNNNTIDGPRYYILPCGRQLEDFILIMKMNFFVGSALKYEWRAGKKDGESRDKDLRKRDHYCKIIANMYGMSIETATDLVRSYKELASKWNGREDELVISNFGDILTR